jgi:predicted GH43/DUF377 family glycosyl hydrolase
MKDSCPNLFRRHESNPILTARDWPYPVHTVFNPAATLLEDGTTLMLVRCEDRRGLSHLCVARSKNGVDGWKMDSHPTFPHLPREHPEELWGIEDARITYMEADREYLISYTAFGKAGPCVAVARTTDFVEFDRIGMVMPADDKDAAFFPVKFDGDYALIHRPITDEGANMWISYSPDLINWGRHKIMLPARRGAWWDANKIGLSPPPIRTDQGWIVMYHGVRRHAAGALYRLGLALFDLENPEICLRRGQCWVFGPEEEYEIVGDVGYVVFPCGWTVQPDGDTVNMYYGAADTCVCLATGSIKEILEYLEEDGATLTGIAGTEAEMEHLDMPV